MVDPLLLWTIYYGVIAMLIMSVLIHVFNIWQAHESEEKKERERSAQADESLIERLDEIIARLKKDDEEL